MKTSRTTSFDGWTLRSDVGELAKDGRKIRLQQHPLLVLEELLARPGELVTREQLIARLWPKGIVEFDTGLNTAVRKLRVALDDVRDEPRYIETIPRKGYRFIGTLDPLMTAAEAQPSAAAIADSGTHPVMVRRGADRRASADTASVPLLMRSRRWSRYALAALVVLAIVGLVYYTQRESANHAPTSEASVQRPAAAEPAIALLPLVAVPTAGPDETLATIVSDVLRDRLTQLQETTVIGATTMRRPGTDPADARQFGASVHARFVIDGKVTPEADGLRLALRIIDIDSGAPVWSFEESRAMSDVAGLVEVAVQGIARHLGVVAHASAEPVAPRPVNLEAYGIYVRAKELMETQRMSDGEAALELFRRATVLDPHFARAYLGLAQAQIFSTGTGNLSDAEQDKRTGEALAAADRAFTLDPRLGEALIERARLTTDLAEADRLFREGLSLAPNYGRGYQRYAEFLFDEYRRGEAIEAIERARVLEPLEPRVAIRLAFFRYLVDSDADAHDRLVSEALAINPKMVTALYQLGLSRWLNGADVADGIRLTEEAIRLDPDYEETINALAKMYLEVDDPASAAWLMELCRSNISSKVDLALFQRDSRRAAQLARETRMEDWLTSWGAPQAWALRDEAIATGDFSRALELMGKRYQLPVSWGPPRTGGPQVQNRTLGLVYAHTLVLAGEVQRGRRLAQTILVQLEGEAVGRVPHFLSRDRAAAFAILGDKKRALEELENSLRIGHYSFWWYYGELDPLYQDLRGEPQFQALVARTREHRARQRALLEEMRKKGEVPTR